MSVSGSFIWPAQHPCVTWGDAHSLCLRWPGSPMSLTQTSHPEYLLSWNVCAGITGSLAKYRCRDEECDGCQCPESSTPAIFTTWLPVANWDEPAGALWSRDRSGPIRGRCSLVTGAPLPPASPPVPCTWCSYGHNNNTRGHMLTLPSPLSGSPPSHVPRR